MEETHRKTGFILSTVAGPLSIFMSFSFGFMYPNLAYAFPRVLVILRVLALIGGILILISVGVAVLNIKVGQVMIFISGIIAGGNILAIVGSILLTKKISTPDKKVTEKSTIYKDTFPFICDSCREFSYNFTEFCEYCGTKGSLREATIIDYEEKRLKQ